MPKASFIYSADMAEYDLGPNHPLRPERLRMTYELASACGLLDGDPQVVETACGELVEPVSASESDILTFHKPAYVQVIKELSRGINAPDAWRFGFGPGDNPPFPGMYEASLLYTGASITAAELIMSGHTRCAFNVSGGLHHAKPANASGFCTFNDPVIAINRLMKAYDRIAYIDIDAHHGDGVQEAFYNTNRVLTISIHESGEYLFPGTGDVHEIGEGDGKGYSVNIPLAPATPDDVYVWAFHEIVPPLTSAYNPQVIVAQLGADSHFQDPLTHLCLTSRGFTEVVRMIVGFGIPLVALGGGGYNISVVPRLWTLAYAEMLHRELPDEIPDAFALTYNLHHLHDPSEPVATDRQRESVKTAVEQKVRALKRLIFHLHGLG